MRTFLDAVTSFPTVVFSVALVLVLCFWLLVAFGAASGDGLDGASGSGSGAFGAGGVPATFGFSVLTVLAWFLSLAADVLLVPPGAEGGAALLAGGAVLVAAPLCAWSLARVFVRPFARLFPDEPPPSRQDFLGLTCTIRTGRVDARFGQAEVAAADGSTALVQVRQHGAEPLALGSTGLLYAWDEDGEFFWVAPYDAALDPRQSPAG